MNYFPKAYDRSRRIFEPGSTTLRKEFPRFPESLDWRGHVKSGKVKLGSAIHSKNNAVLGYPIFVMSMNVEQGKSVIWLS